MASRVQVPLAASRPCRGLSEHPWIDAVVGADDGEPEFLQFIFAEAAIETPWDKVFTLTYRSDASMLAGWNSSLESRAYSVQEMDEWVESTMSLIREQPIKSVLDIGAGTGLIATALVDDVERYVCIEPSPPAVKSLSRLAETVLRPRSVEVLVCRASDDWSVEETFDLVLLNSVVQYLSGPAELLGVLRKAFAHLNPGGRVIVGDVLAAETFVDYLEQRRSSPLVRSPIDHVTEFTKQPELWVDSEFFRRLPAAIPEISNVEIRAKRGRAKTEMNLFRYDVVMRVDAVKKCRFFVSEWLNTESAIRQMLRLEEGECQRIRRCPRSEAHRFANTGLQGLTDSLHEDNAKVRLLWSESAGLTDLHACVCGGFVESPSSAAIIDLPVNRLDELDSSTALFLTRFLSDWLSKSLTLSCPVPIRSLGQVKPPIEGLPL